MGKGRPTLPGAVTITIRELFGLPEVRAGLNVDERNRIGAKGGELRGGADVAEKVAVLLDDESFRKLFEPVVPLTYVSGNVVAAYTGLSKLTIERALDAAYSVPPKPAKQKVPATPGIHWRVVLNNHSLALQPGPALLNAQFRWWFVTGELAGLLEEKIDKAKEARQNRTAAVGTPEPSTPVLSLRNGAENRLFVLDPAGRVLGELKQGHMTAALIIDALNSGGELKQMSAFEAISLAWNHAAARAPWVDAIREAIARDTAMLLSMVEGGESATDQARFRDSMPLAKGDRVPPKGGYL